MRSLALALCTIFGVAGLVRAEREGSFHWQDVEDGGRHLASARNFNLSATLITFRCLGYSTTAPPFNCVAIINASVVNSGTDDIAEPANYSITLDNEFIINDGIVNNNVG
jgi:hypothetical protein